VPGQPQRAVGRVRAVTGQPVLPGSSRLRGQGFGPVGEHPRSSGQGRQLGRQRSFRSGLEAGRIAVPPAAVPAPHGVHDELGLVVDRPQVGPVHQVSRRHDAVNRVIQPAASVHHRERLVDE